jgi:hypothetical protein
MYTTSYLFIKIRNMVEVWHTHIVADKFKAGLTGVWGLIITITIITILIR